MLGNPFSPAYASARRRGPADPLRHCALNVAVYTRSGNAWALDEQRVSDGDRTASGVAIGASSMRWDCGRLTVRIDERTAPFGGGIRGKVVVHPEAMTGLDLRIDNAGDHHWWPVAPLARIEVDLERPDLRFRGHGYHDANAGNAPLESAFEEWAWSRARSRSQGALLTYDVSDVDGGRRSLALRVSPRGDVTDLDGLAATELPRTGWGLARSARVDVGSASRVVRTLENGPFYARSLVETRLGGESVVAMHESLAAHRLRSRWVQHLIGYRMRSRR